MIVNKEFKKFRETTEYRIVSVVAHSSIIASFKYWYNSSFFPCSRIILLGQAHVKYMPKNRNKNTRTTFYKKPGISSILTYLEGFRLLMALQISASEMGARDTN
jgi:hypothetical protein